MCRRKTLNFDWFGLVWFYGTATIMGYLMSNTVRTHILSF